MNAYIASFMLLVFNAVGLAMPAIGAVTEERVATNVKPVETHNSVTLTGDGLEIDQADQCSSMQSIRVTGFDHVACHIYISSSVPQIVNVENGGAAAILVLSPERLKSSDNQHIEGAP
ncbi:MAG: hypothetical protein Pars2KO_20040 [Parasphingorhabdus sp.]